MGRHSIPDGPDESAGEPIEPGGGDESPDRGYQDFEDYGDYGDQPDHGDYDQYSAPPAHPEQPGLEQPDLEPGRTESPRPSFAAEPPAGPVTGGHRIDGEWTGSHRVADHVHGRRGVSLGVIAALVTVVVVVAGVIVWRFFGDALSDRSTSAADRCLGGEASVAVVADPAIADSITAFAQNFNESAGPVGDKCVTVKVTPAESDAVVSGLVGSWPDTLGAKPALWIPGSSIASARLQAASGPKLVSSARSVATSPVLLAVRPELKAALSDQNWSTLPALQTNEAGLDGLGLAGWGALRLALPMTGDSDAAYLAAEAVASASAPGGSPATAGIGAVNTLVGAAPKLTGNSLDAAMKALLDSSDPAAAPVHAVVTTEQQLYKRAAGLPDAKGAIAGWTPPGPAAVADYPAVLLSGDWISEEQASAASEFERFVHKPEQLDQLAQVGFRTEGHTPTSNDVTAFAPLASTLSIGDDAARVAVANVLGPPVTGSTPSGQSTAGQTTSIMLDRSLDLAPVVAALNNRIGALPPTAAVGLTTFDGSLGSTLVNVGGLGDPVEGQTRGQAITSALNGLSSSGGGAVSFTTLRNVYAEAQANYRPGQPNSVLVITAGPHTDQSLGSEGLQELIRSSADPARPVAVNVINVGDDPDRPTWEAVAQISGGTYQNVPSSDSPELSTALATMLG